MKNWFVYIIRCRDSSLYTGITLDVKKRFHEHLKGKGAKYLRGKTPLSLEYYELIGSKSKASKIEAAIKKFSKLKKESVIQNQKLPPELVSKIILSD